MKLAGSVNDELVDYRTHVDHDTHMAFVCVAGDAIVGDARYVSSADRASCELGIVIADDWHHTGIAQRLMAALLDAARARGLKRMHGLVYADNRDMLDFTRELGFEPSAGPEGTGTVRIAKEL